MFAFLARNAKLFALIGGFVFATLGTLWSFLVTDNLSGEIQRLANAKQDIAAQVETLDKLASEYFMLNQQGDLIFMTAQRSDANPEVARLIYQGNLLDRAAPVRNMLGALALQKQLDYAQSYGAYEKLNDAARANLTFENYTQLKQAESDIISKGQARIPVLVNAKLELDKALNEKQAEQARNRLIGLVAAILGSAMLLGANVLAERKKK